MTKSSSAAPDAFRRADWFVSLLVNVAVLVLTLPPGGQPRAAPAPPGYDPGAQVADDEGELVARTIAFNTQAVPGTAATPHEQSDGSAQTGKP